MSINKNLNKGQRPNAQQPVTQNSVFEEAFFHSDGTYIHPTSIIGKDVTLGQNVKIGPYCTIVGKVSIDDDSRIYGYVTIGMPAQDINTQKPLGSVEIGKSCEIREFVTIGSPKTEGSKTIIGNECYVMNFSHVAHDVVLENNVVLINSVNLGGHVYIEHHVMLMANTAIHQFCRVGAYSALAPFSGMRQDLPPFSLYNGTPGYFAGLNALALRRAKFSSQEINNLKTVTKLFFQDKVPFDRLIKHVEQNEQLQESKHVQHFLHFVQNSDRGISRKTFSKK